MNKNLNLILLTENTPTGATSIRKSNRPEVIVLFCQAPVGD